MNEITKESFTFHLGVALATECVQSFSAMAKLTCFKSGYRKI